MNIIEQRREKAWGFAKTLILKKLMDSIISGSLIYRYNLTGKDALNEPDVTAEEIVDDALFSLRNTCEKEGIKPTKESFARACRSKALGNMVLHMWRTPFKYWD